MPELDLAAIANRWSTYGGMGNPRSADDYTDAGCRIFAEHGFHDIPALVSRVRELEAAKVWVVLSHCYEDVRVEDVFDSREQAEAEYDVRDGNGFPTGYEIVEKDLIREETS